MYRNQPITTYRRDLLNLLKKACVSWDRGGSRARVHGVRGGGGGGGGGGGVAAGAYSERER